MSNPNSAIYDYIVRDLALTEHAPDKAPITIICKSLSVHGEASRRHDVHAAEGGHYPQVSMGHCWHAAGQGAVPSAPGDVAAWARQMLRHAVTITFITQHEVIRA